MVRPSQLAAARTVADRRARTRKMADVMRRYEAADGACTRHHLRTAGFTEAEIQAYADDARALLSGRPYASHRAVSPARKEAAALVAKAIRIRRRQEARA